MSQRISLPTRSTWIDIVLPDAHVEVIPGVVWGALDAFPTPAYWMCQVETRRHRGSLPQYRIGNTLTEEVVACLLGGHGVSGPVGVAAFEHLRDCGLFTTPCPDEGHISTLLQQPLHVGDRKVRYRFAAQKARYIAAALPRLARTPDISAGRSLRDWLLSFPGIGYKTSSWVARNWLDSDDVAILDIHVLRFGRAIGLFPAQLKVERHYLELEERFLALCTAMGGRASELDTVIWHEMAASPRAVRALIDCLN